MSDKNFIWFENISESDKRIVGEKAFNFNQMIDADFTVPLGFVITSEAYGDFVSETGIVEEINQYLSDFDPEDGEDLEETGEKIRNLILETEIPEDIEDEMVDIYRDLCDRVGEIDAPVYFRTSVYVGGEVEDSVPGKEATCLAVSGEDGLLKHLKEAWAFLFSDQVISYFNEKGYAHEDVSVSVIVQNMVEAEKGGVFFTSHPSTGEKDKMVVEANWGLEETVISGSVTPDTYILDKEDKEIVYRAIGSKEEMLVYDSMEGGNERKQTTAEERESQVVSEEEAAEMVDLARELEEHYDEPQEVEWAKERGEIYLVESSPMEVISQESFEESEEEAIGERSETLSKESDSSRMPKSVISPTVTDVKVNISAPENANSIAKSTGADGVGLLKPEQMISDIGKHPVRLIDEGGEERIKSKIKEGIKQSAEAFSSESVWYRTLDLNSEDFFEFSAGDRADDGSNPMMGERGARGFLNPENVKEQEILKTELRAVRELVEEGFDNIGVMISMVQSPKELRRFKRISREVGLEPHVDFEVGIMLDVPAAALIIDEFIEEGVDFVSFDSGALTQFTLGVDKENERVNDLYYEQHPAVEKLLKEAVGKCREKNVESSVCGSAEISLDFAKNLVKYGVKSISVNPSSVKEIREIIGKTEKEIILEKVREELDD